MKLLVLLMLVGCVGCQTRANVDSKQEEMAKESARDHNWDLLFFRLEDATVLNNDTAATLDCAGEDLETGRHDGPSCQRACVTDAALAAFEQSHLALMVETKSKLSEPHDWCKANAVKTASGKPTEGK